ncbi:MAG: hypothetical protein H7841_13550 [Magnetospirillum sp. WYHS-4]
MVSERFMKAVLATGVPEVDDEHASLLGHARELERAFLTGASRQYLLLLLENFMLRMESHFRAEEAMADQGLFVVSDGHLRDHQRILREMRGTRAALELMTESISVRDMFRTEDRLVNHIIRFDLEIRHGDMICHAAMADRSGAPATS